MKFSNSSYRRTRLKSRNNSMRCKLLDYHKITSFNPRWMLSKRSKFTEVEKKFIQFLTICRSNNLWTKINNRPPTLTEAFLSTHLAHPSKFTNQPVPKVTKKSNGTSTIWRKRNSSHFSMWVIIIRRNNLCKFRPDSNISPNLCPTISTCFNSRISTCMHPYLTTAQPMRTRSLVSIRSSRWLLLRSWRRTSVTRWWKRRTGWERVTPWVRVSSNLIRGLCLSTITWTMERKVRIRCARIRSMCP